MIKINSLDQLNIGDYVVSIEKTHDNDDVLYYDEIEYRYFEQITKINDDGYYSKIWITDGREWIQYYSCWDMKNYDVYLLDLDEVTALLI